MSQPLPVPGVLHISSQEIRDGALRGAIRDTDRVVIPAKHEPETIATTVGYLLGLGFVPGQIIVLVNGPSEINGKPDETADRARSVSSDLQVYHQSEVLAASVNDIPLISHLEQEYGIRPTRLHGKGTAMFAACLALHRAGTSDNARIFFLDADINNASEVDPVGRLLIGSDGFPGTVRLVKLASLGRDNAGIHAFLSTLEGKHSLIAALQWILCGQAIIYWSDLKRMRLASGYAVEMAIMMDLIARAEDPQVFGEVEIDVPLRDRKDSDRVHVRMYAEIMMFLTRIQRYVGGLPSLNRIDMRAVNSMAPAKVWTPVKARGDGPNQLELRYPDAVLPSIDELYS